MVYILYLYSELANPLVQLSFTSVLVSEYFYISDIGAGQEIQTMRLSQSRDVPCVSVIDFLKRVLTVTFCSQQNVTIDPSFSFPGPAWPPSCDGVRSPSTGGCSPVIKTFSTLAWATLVNVLLLTKQANHQPLIRIIKEKNRPFFFF